MRGILQTFLKKLLCVDLDYDWQKEISSYMSSAVLWTVIINLDFAGWLYSLSLVAFLYTGLKLNNRFQFKVPKNF